MAEFQAPWLLRGTHSQRGRPEALRGALLPLFILRVDWPLKRASRFWKLAVASGFHCNSTTLRSDYYQILWRILQLTESQENTLPLKLEAVATAFYNDIEDGFRDGAVALLSEQSKRPFTDVVDFLASDLEIPKIYVVCKNDNAVPFAFQQFMAQASGAEIVELDCGHSPFLREEERRQIVDLIIGVSQ